MNVIVAMDSFKGSLTSIEAGNAVKDGILRADGSARIEVCPVADGGEGTIDAVCEALGGDIIKIKVTGPLGEPVMSRYGIVKGIDTAIIEMSEAAGITLVPPDKRNPLYTTTFGVGELIRDAIKRGCRKFIIGIGGSATNDGGVGMLKALGFSFTDGKGQEIDKGAIGLSKLCSISDEKVIKELKSCYFNIACDVKNVLCGAEGCSHVYGPQKGADAGMISDMDKWLSDYAGLCAQKYPDRADPEKEGCGAAGGLGFAFLTFMNSELKPGIDIVLDITGLEEKIRGADIVITGEGRLDIQSINGKTPVGVARMAKKYGKPVIAFAGCIGDNADVCNEHGIDAYFPVLKRPCTLEEAMDKKAAYKNLSDCAEQEFRAVKIRL